MIASTRAFFISALIALPVAAVFNVLALLGVGTAWPAMVHLTLFGWITLMIVAVNYHTMPVFAARDFPTPRLIWAHWAALNAGLVVATARLVVIWNSMVIAGLLLQLIAALLFVANTILLFVRGPRRAIRPPLPPIAGQPQVDRIGTSATKLAGIMLPAALLLLLLVRLGWVNGAWVLAAEHLVTLGWLMLMVAGVAYHVLPRFSGHGTRGPGWARTQLLCHIAALALMVPALGFGWSQIFALGGALMALALGLFAWTVYPTVKGSFEMGDRRFLRRRPAIIQLQSSASLEERSK